MATFLLVSFTLFAFAGNSLLAIGSAHLSGKGILLAFLSGAVTSGLGYAIWYKTLPRVSAHQASILQLLVPVIAALGGVFVLSEPISMRLVVATAVILGGVFLAVRRPSVK